MRGHGLVGRRRRECRIAFDELPPAQSAPSTPSVVLGLLGPLEVIGAASIRVPPGRQQAVLAALALAVGRVVSSDHLVDVVWAQEPPDTARTQVQICVSRLRRLLEPTGATIETQPPGYRLSLAPEALDVHRFHALVRSADRLVLEGQDLEAVTALRSAAALWRGPALSGVDSEALRAQATRLDEDRLVAQESGFEIELRLGRHARLIGEITALVEAHPLRERLRAQLMLALYRSGRQAEALEVYRAFRALLADDLGLEPGPELRELERAILTADASLRAPDPAEAGVLSTGAVSTGALSMPPTDTPTPPVGGPTAFQLPTAPADFVGRTQTLDLVRSVLLDDPTTVGIAVLLGPPGVGKSATAVQAGHLLGAEHFPDGQLYCDLRAIEDDPLSPADVLGRFLRALGVPPPAIPPDAGERGAMFRGMVADRRVLIVLDDAGSEAQVTPLLPGSPQCGVIVTSRSRLTAVPGATCLEIDVLTVPTALRLLSQTLGRERVDAEPEAALALVHATGRLPLALRIVAARLTARSHWPLAGLVNRLADERRRLDELSHGDLTLRAGMSLAHDGFDPLAARTFALLALLTGPTIPAWAAGALVDDDRPFPSDLTEPLVDVHLLDAVGVDVAGETVHRFQELVRVFALEKLAESADAPMQRAAVERFTGGWLTLLTEANARLLGGDFLQIDGGSPRWTPPQGYRERLLADPYRWFETERSALRDVVELAAAHGLVTQCWELVVRASIMLERRGYLTDLAALHACALTAVDAAGDRLGAAALVEVANSGLRDRYDTATRRALLEQALADLLELGNRTGEGLVRRQLAHLLFTTAGDDPAGHAAAVDHGEQALAAFVDRGDLGGQWRTLMLLGREAAGHGATEQGRARLAEALELAHRTGDRRAIAQVLRASAGADTADGRTDLAEEKLTAALELVRELGDPLGEAMVMRDLARVQLGRSRGAEARAALLASRDLFAELRQEAALGEVERMIAALG
nr:BTAD domain-containing putative transcriptional regulator [Nakamurella flavida]